MMNVASPQTPMNGSAQTPMNIVVLDVESTGKERSTDQIIELCLQLGVDADSESRSWRIRPSIAIHAEATGVHGITAEDVAACPPFAEVAREFLPTIEAADVVVGYNVAFDLDMLQAELARAGLPTLDLGKKQIVDVLRLWQRFEPRTLVAAHQKFCGEALVDAHQASADVAATARVLVAMQAAFGIADKSWSDLAGLADPFPGRASWVGASSHLQWNDGGHVVLSFGKHKGCRIDQVDSGFLRWVLSKDFPPHVKDVCRAVTEMRGLEFLAWIGARFPRPAPVAAEDSP